MAHKMKYMLLTSEPPKHQARCECKWASVQSLNEGDVSEDVFKHQQIVQQTRAQSSRPPTLHAERDWAFRQYENPQNPKAERDLWKRLADDMTRRLNDTTDPTEGQGTLQFGL